MAAPGDRRLLARARCHRGRASGRSPRADTGMGHLFFGRSASLVAPRLRVHQLDRGAARSGTSRSQTDRGTQGAAMAAAGQPVRAGGPGVAGRHGERTHVHIRRRAGVRAEPLNPRRRPAVAADRRCRHRAAGYG